MSRIEVALAEVAFAAQCKFGRLDSSDVARDAEHTGHVACVVMQRAFGGKEKRFAVFGVEIFLKSLDPIVLHHLAVASLDESSLIGWKNPGVILAQYFLHRLRDEAGCSLVEQHIASIDVFDEDRIGGTLGNGIEQLQCPGFFIQAGLGFSARHIGFVPRLVQHQAEDADEQSVCNQESQLKQVVGMLQPEACGTGKNNKGDESRSNESGDHAGTEAADRCAQNDREHEKDQQRSFAERLNDAPA